MSKIEQLIQELCPGGVPTKKVEQLGSFFSGLTGKSKDDFKEGNAKFITYKNIFSNPSLNLDFNDKVKVEDGEKQNVVVYGDVLFTGSSETPDECGMSSVVTEHPNEAMYLNSFCFGWRLEDKSIYLPQFLKHLLRCQSIRNQIAKTANGVTRYNVSKKLFGKIQIPLPPLPIQQEIVRILDTFTEAQANLEQELELRKKQYEYYRNQLLSFDENVERVSFGNSFQLKARIGWQGLTKKEYRSSGEYKLVTGTDFTNNHTIDFSTCVYVDKERYDQDEYIQLKEDDVLITKDGTLGKVAYIDKLEYPTTLNGGVFVVRDLTGRVIQKFTKHYLCSYNFKSWMEMNHTSGSIQHLTQKLLVNFMIPVPSKERQQEIVSILDKFESAIQTLEEELALRKKQYEYYREKLLTFKSN